MSESHVLLLSILQWISECMHHICALCHGHKYCVAFGYDQTHSNDLYNWPDSIVKFFYALLSLRFFVVATMLSVVRFTSIHHPLAIACTGRRHDA